MSSAPAAEQIAKDATWLPQALDPSAGQVRLIAMSRESYRAASFLDDRMLQQPIDAQVVAWTRVEAAVSERMRNDARWIFHIGHVGSTLLSRLLGELDGVLALREPRLLRDLALSPPDMRARYLPPVPRLLSRTFAPGELACVKATSWASEIAPELVPPGERALFMYATPANYVASILAGENSVKEVRALADARTRRMAGRVEGLQEQLRSDAHLAAAAWACEMISLEAAAERMPGRGIAWVDFDQMLEAMSAELEHVAEHFGFAVYPSQIAAITSGPLIKRYSKALEYEYSAGLRRELIAEAMRFHARDMDDALAMVRSAAEKSPLLARALERSEES